MSKSTFCNIFTLKFLGFKCRVLTGLWLLFTLIAGQAFAEGSKELNPTGGHRVYLYTSTTTTTSLPWANQGLVRVYVKQGETINVGSSVQGLGDGTIILVSPNGTRYLSGNSTTVGRIDTRAQEMAGPLPNAGGYTPYTRTVLAAEEGIWSIFFVGSNGTNNGVNSPGKKLSADVWDQPNNSPYIAAFDVSVRNAANTAFIPGRAYMNLLEGLLGDFDARFTGKLNVLTNDGYIYEVNPNGLAGNGFAFFSNNKGFKSGANPSYASQDGTSTANVHPPLSNDTATDVTHKLFFNTPSSDLPASAPARTTTGLEADLGSASTTWLKTTPVSPTVTNFTFTGKEGTPNQAGATSTMGGYITFVANQTGNYSIKIDANKDGDFTDAADRVITNPAVIGTNTFFWDGLDGAGAAVSGAFGSSAIQVVLRAGEVHFPLLDVENNPNGIIITRMNGVGSGDQTVYWNDNSITSASNPSSPRNTSVNGVSSASNGHKWGSTAYNAGSFGNEKGLDTWTYVFSTPEAPALPIQFLSANLEVLPITKSTVSSICIGQQQTYTVSVRNNGPSAVTDAKFNFTFPTQLTGVVITPVVTSGTASVVSSTISGTQYNASLDMNNASVITFTITGTVSLLPASSTLSVSASVLRPADVYDPDATNPDADIPSNPQSECDAAPSGIGCNNVQTDATPVALSNLSIANVSVAEGSGGSNNMTFTVTASPANAACAVTVDYEISHGTTNAADFAGTLTGTVTIPAGQATQTFSVPIATDQIIEANETFTVTIKNPSSGAVITTATATGTILDDDNIPVNKALVITSTDGAEGVSPGATFSIAFPTGITADKDTEIQYTLSGTATGNGTDYTGVTAGTIIIPALTNSVSITLPVIDDVILEGTETVIFTAGIVTTPYAGINVSNSPASLNIADDDNAILISGPAQVVEGNSGKTYVTFRVSLDITTASAFTVDYLTEDGVATAADNDYVPKSGTLSFTGNNPGEYHDIQIEINGDLKIEGNEAFKVKLQGLSNTFGGLLTISGSPATISILDDDNTAANKTITITKTDGREGGVDAEFLLSFPSGVSIDEATTISYTLTGLAIGSGTDYNGVTTGTVTIPAGANSAPVSRSIVDDLIIEGSESIIITTGTVTNSKYNGIGVANSPLSLDIIDNDNTAANNTITLSTEIQGAEPATDGRFRVSYPAGIVRSTPTVVNYTIAGTAANGVDYNSLSGTVTIPAFSNSAPIDVLVKDDQIIEQTETVALTLTSAIAGTASLNVRPGTESINISDNDNIASNNIITLTKVLDAEEGLIEGKFRVSYPAGYVSSVPTTVNYTIGGTAVNGTDYQNISGQVIIPAGSNYSDIDIVVTDDLIIETTETIGLALTTATSSISALTVNPAATVTADLRDNDNIAGNSIITLTKIADGAEPATAAEFMVSYPAGITSAEPTTVNYIVTGTATGGVDYVALSGSVTIPAGDNSAPIKPGVLDDQLIEGNETIILTLTGATSPISVPGLTVNPAGGVSADIVDDDNTPTNTKIIVAKTADGTEPGTKAQFTFSYPAGIKNAAPTIVNFSVAGTATNGVDYTIPHNSTITIPANTNSYVFDVTTKNDYIIEPTETVIINSVTASSTTVPVIAVEPSGPVTASIDDDDNTAANKTITITKVDGVEGMLNGSFSFSFPTGITASSDTEITFTLTGTADGGGVDYTATPSPISIVLPAGQNSVSLPLLIMEDDIIENIETVTLTTTGISNSGLTGIVIGNSPVTLNISDNDDYTTLSVSDATVTEGNSGFVTLNFNVSLAKATGKSFSVKYITEDVTATAAGNDYQTKQDVLNFSGLPGESYTVSVQVRGDQMIEMTETLRLRLYDLSDNFGGRLSYANSLATGSITDDDLTSSNAKITITLTPGSETGPTPGTFTFSFPTDVSADAPTAINLGLSGSAQSIDYTGSATASVTIPAGANSFTLTLPVIDDAIAEINESIVLTTGSVSSPYGITVANSPQSIEIADNDQANLSIASATVVEGNSGSASLVFTVTLDKDTGSPFTVEYKTSDGTAIAGEDYTATSGLLTFAGTAGTQTISVPVKGDRKVEPNETISIKLENLSNNFDNRLAIPLAGSSATGTINNDDSAVITITSTDGAEAGAVPGTFTFSFPAGVTMDTPTTISYSLSGTAESAKDFTGAISGTVVIPANATSYQLTLPVLPDLVVEDTETVILSTGLISSSYPVSVSNSPVTLNIIDKDQAIVSLTGPATVTEGDSGSKFVTYTATLNQATTGSFTVDYATSNGTATIADKDYVGSSGRLTFAGAAGETQTFTVEIKGDQKIEAAENFSVTLSNLIASFSNRPVVQSAALLTSIQNDDAGNITITSLNGSENGPQPASFTFSFPQDITSDAATTIYIGLTGTAQPADYTGAATSSVTIPIGQNSYTLTLPVADDGLAELTETIVVSTGSISSPYTITVDNSPQTLEILDNDAATLTISGSSLAEGNSGNSTLNFTVTLDKNTGGAFTVNYSTSDGTATVADDDYVPVSGTLTFNGTAGSQTVSVPLKGDGKLELDEVFTLTLGSLSSNFDNRLIIPVAGKTASGTISNDDAATVTLAASDGSEAGAVPGTFTFSLPAGVTVDAPTVIHYTLTGSAESGKDYSEAVSGSVTIPAKTNSETFNISVVDDAIVEDPENVILTIGSIVSPYDISAANSPQTLKIIDNDQATVTLTGDPQITEGDSGTKTVTYTATLDKAVQGGFKVDYNIAGGTATLGDNDFNNAGATLTFAGTAGETKSFTVEINGDLKIEANETFSVSLSNLVTSQSNRPVLQAAPVVTTIENDDDDQGIITITSTDGSEAGAIPGKFTFSFPTNVKSDAPTTITFALTGTATGADYTGAGTTSVTIPIGENSYTLDLPVSPDALVEGAETVVITTGAVSSPYNITVANSPQSLKITDDDNAVLTVAGTARDEGDLGSRVLNFTVTLNKATGSPFTVNYATSDGSAKVSDNDYVAATGTLSFSGLAGESRNVAVTLTGDKKIEADENFFLTLSNLSNPFDNTLVINGSPATGVISNDDNGVITITPEHASETGPTPGAFIFSLPAGTTMDAPLTINYTLSGIAESTKDFTGSASGTVTIDKDKNSYKLTLPVIDDNIIEDAETIILTTGIVSGQYNLPVVNSPQSLTIEDNDQAALTLTGPPTVTEGDAGSKLVTYTVTLDKATQGGFSIDYKTTSGTATLADDDYESSSGTLNFAGTAAEQKTFTVQINGDKKIEANETYSVALSNLVSSFANKPQFQTSAFVTVVENDDAGAITVSSTNGSEAGPVPATFTFRFPDGISSDAATVINFAFSGSATGADFTGAGVSSVTIPAGDNSFTLTLPVTDDLITEGTETILINTASVTGPYSITISNPAYSLEILDNDNASVSISGGSVTEGNSGTSSMTFTVTLDKATRPFSLKYATSDGTALLSNNDYSAAAGSINFDGTAGESHTVTVSVKGDGLVEANETLSMVISDLSDNFGGALAIATNTATGIITNDDSGLITISSTNGMEAGAVPGTFTFSFAAGVTMDAPTTISYTLSGTAESGNDYTGPISGSVTIPANTGYYKLTLPVLPDMVAEDTETVILTTGIISSPYAVSVSNSPQSLNIIDTDQAVLILSGDAEITEGHSGTRTATYTVTLNRATAGSFSVDYGTASGTAVVNEDFETATGSLNFAGTAGETQTFSVLIKGDKKIEADENFSVSLSNVSSSLINNPLILNPTIVTSIKNDDSGLVTISTSNGSETGPVPGVFTFSFPEDVTSDKPTIIHYGLSGTAEAADYTGAGALFVTILPNERSAELRLDVNDDLTVEGTETIILSTGSINSPYQITVANSPATLTIADNDNALLSLVGGTITEGAGGVNSLNFTVILNKNTKPFTVDYSTSDGTATTADNDYVAANGTLSFAGSAGESKTISVQVKGDKKIEADEGFMLALSNLSSNFSNKLSLAGSPAMGVIANDDSGVITISPINGTEQASGPASFSFSLPEGTTVDSPITVSYTLTGSAESIKDYTGALSGSVTIPKDGGSYTLTLPVIDDAKVEENETITLTTGIVHGPYNLTVVNSPQTAIITDNDQAMLSLTGPASINEGDAGSQLVTYTVALNNAVQGGFSVDYHSSNGSARYQDEDYEESTGTLAFAGLAGETKTFTVRVNADRIIEADENFSVFLSDLISASTNRPVMPAAGVVTTIVNDDEGTVTITAEDGSETGPVPASFSFSFPADMRSDSPTTINFSLGGSATGTDYTGANVISATIPAGENSFTLSLPVTDDVLVEGIEQVVLTAADINSPYPITLTNTSQSLNIRDNDSASLSITGSAVTEGDVNSRAMNFTVSLNKGTGPFSIKFNTKDGSATVADNDYEAQTGTLNFSGVAGESKLISIPIKGDKKIEANEVLSVELKDLSQDFNNALSIAGGEATGTIIDDDNIAINKRITITTVDGSESGTPAFVRFSLPEDVSSDGITTIPYTLSGVALGGGTDYAAASTGVVYINANERSAELPLGIIDDTLIEGTETVVINTGAITNDKYTGFLPGNAQQTLSIFDNDVALLSVDGPVSIQEGHSGSRKLAFNVRLDKATGSGFSVKYNTEDGTALASDNDYIPENNGTLVFEGKAGEMRQIEVTIIGDKKVEQNESYRVRLTSLSADFGGSLRFANTSAIATIVDDDNSIGNKEITITQTNGTEGASNATFTFSLPAGVSLDAPTYINYTLSGTARGSNIDYKTPQVGVVEIKAGSNYGALTIDITDDSGLESAETVIVNAGAISNSSYNDIKVLNSPQTLYIEDDDNASLSITGPITVTEGNSGTTNAVFRVTLNNSTGDPFTVNYLTKDGTATLADEDYIASSGTLTFLGSAGEFHTIEVPVKGDLKIERNERFNLQLTGLSNDFDQRLGLPVAPAVGVIRDDDNTALNRRLIVTRVNAFEGGVDGRYKFSFQPGVSTDDYTIINYIFSGTALGDGTDYSVGTRGQLIIPPGQNSVLVDLSVIDDGIIEAQETVVLAGVVVSNDSHTGISTGNTPASVTITDNDTGDLKLSGPVVLKEGNTGTSLATFSLTLSAATDRPFSIGYRSLDGTAKASDNDYVANASNISFAGNAGEVQEISIVVNGDLKIEDDEEFNLQLHNLSNSFGDNLKYDPTPAKGRILNDDNGTISISSTPGKEGAGGGVFTFSLPTGVYSDKPILIPYRLTGTALPGRVDYRASGDSSVTIPAFQNKADLKLVIIDDAIIEPRETVKLTTGIALSSRPDAVLVENSPQELIIQDNDAAPIVVTNPVITKEGHNVLVTATFDATLPLATATGFTLDYVTADGTAKVSDGDYLQTAGRLTFSGAAGEVHKIKVQLRGDTRVEGNEDYFLRFSNLSNTFDNQLSLKFDEVKGVIFDDDNAPIALDDSTRTNEDVPVTFSLTANDTDVDGLDPTSLKIKIQPDKGTVKVNRDGTVTYNPALNDNGTRSFTYTVKDITGLESNEARVSVRIIPVNDPPVALDDRFFVRRDSSLRAQVSTNDSDPDGDELQFNVLTNPTKGKLVSFGREDGFFIYTPIDTTFKGYDQFSYRVTDAAGLTEDATVTLGVQPGVVVSLKPEVVKLKEGESIVITAELSESILQDIDIAIGYDGTARVDSDYTRSGDFLTMRIDSGQTTTTQKIILSTVKDFLKEGDELAEVSITTATPSAFVTIGNGSLVTITELNPQDKPIGPDENGDIAPDPYTSPDGDGLGNESFVINNIDKYPDNEVVIYNRWGNEVFRVKGYNNKDKAFTGLANSGLLVNKNATLPEGVYYFIIYTKVDGKMKLNKGYVIVRR